jgi:hypothetical protein
MEIDIAAVAVEDSAPQLIRNGFGEIMIGFYDDVVVVPWDVYYCEAGEEQDAGVQLVYCSSHGGKCLPAYGEGKEYGTLAILLFEGSYKGRLVPPSQRLPDRSPCPIRMLCKSCRTGFALSKAAGASSGTR